MTTLEIVIFEPRYGYFARPMACLPAGRDFCSLRLAIHGAPHKKKQELRAVQIPSIDTIKENSHLKKTTIFFYARPMGFEPTISSVTRRRVKPGYATAAYCPNHTLCANLFRAKRPMTSHARSAWWLETALYAPIAPRPLPAVAGAKPKNFPSFLI